MKVNIVSGATYYPTKITNNINRATETGGQKNIEPNKISNFEKILFEKLNADEAAEIQKLFGDFNIDKTGKNVGSNNSFAGKLGAIPRGKFVDIKI